MCRTLHMLRKDLKKFFLIPSLTLRVYTSRVNTKRDYQVFDSIMVCSNINLQQYQGDLTAQSIERTLCWVMSWPRTETSRDFSSTCDKEYILFSSGPQPPNQTRDRFHERIFLGTGDGSGSNVSDEEQEMELHSFDGCSPPAAQPRS